MPNKRAFRRRTTEPIDRRRRFEFGLLAAALLGLLASFPYFEATRNANERARLLQAAAVWERGQWSLDAAVRAKLDPGPDIAKGTLGRLFPNKPPGTTLAVVPGYAIAKAWADGAPTMRAVTWWGRLLSGVLPTVVLIAFAYRWIGRSQADGTRIDRKAVGAAVVLYAAGTPAFAYAHLAYGHQLAACLLAIGIAVLFDGLQRRSNAAVALGSMSAGAAVAVEYLVAFAGIPIAIAILFGRHRPALVGIAIAAALVPIAGLMLYHDAAFGSPWSTGYHHVVDPVFAEKHGQGLLGLSAPRLDGFIDHVLAPDTGLLWWIPAVGWAVWGLGLAAKGAGAAATVARVWLAILGLFVLASTMLSFDGGWRVGPRYMVAVLPALMWGWSSAWTRLQSLPPTVARLNLALVGALAAYQVIVNVLAGSLWPHLDPTNIHAPLADVLVPLLLAGRVPYTAFGVAVPAVLQWLAMAAIVVAALGVIVAGLAGGIDGRERRLGALAMGIALGSFAVVAVSLLPAHPKAAANLAYIERVWEPPTAGAARSQTLELASAKNGP